MKSSTVVIVGVGDGLSASLARRFHHAGHKICLAARNTEKLTSLAAQTNASVHRCDAAEPASVAALFTAIEGEIAVVIYNPSARQRGALVELDVEQVRHAISVTAFGAFLVGQQAATRMLGQLPRNGARGTILFTGASAGVKGFPLSAPFAMGKFAQRGLAQSMSRELHPQGIHVAWINIDGGIRSATRTVADDQPDSLLDPDAIAETYFDIASQHRSAWSEEIAVRPWVEKF